MRHSCVPWLSAAAAVLLTAATALGLGGDHPKGTLKLATPGWPKGLPDLLNAGPRVHGIWVNSNDFFYYKGDAAELNTFLAGYGGLTDTPLLVVLHSGDEPLTGPLGGDRTLPYNWQLDVMRRGWGAPLDPDRPRDNPGYVVTLHVWLSAKVPLKALKMPAGVRVQSAKDPTAF